MVDIRVFLPCFVCSFVGTGSMIKSILTSRVCQEVNEGACSMKKVTFSFCSNSAFDPCLPSPSPVEMSSFWTTRVLFELGGVESTALKLADLLPAGCCVAMSEGQGLGVVLGSPVQSSLLSNFDKTETWTSPHKSTNLEKLDWTDVNWFSAVFVGFLWLKDWSQPVCTGVWGVGSTLTVVPTVNKFYMKTNYITLWAPARKAPPLTE